MEEGKRGGVSVGEGVEEGMGSRAGRGGEVAGVGVGGGR